MGELLELLGIKLFSRERSLVQYLRWSLDAGLFRFLGRHGTATKGEVVQGTSLTEAGADSLLGVMCALGFLHRSPAGKYGLQPVACDYLLESSPFFIGNQIDARGFPVPGTYLRGRSSLLTMLKLRLLSLSPAIRYGSMTRLLNQHARNLPACAAAVRTGEFAGIASMVDIAGGSGTFSIPLARDCPGVNIVLTDLPAALDGARKLLATHGLEKRVKLHELDALRYPWDIPECDGIFIGNFLHGFDDVACLAVLREARRHLSKRGRLWIHEMLWRESRDGPLITALYHAAMRGAGPGRQRSGTELSQMLRLAGFSDIRITTTTGAYALVSGSGT